MKISIQCDCGNEVVVQVLPKKYSQFRDELDVKSFYYDVKKTQTLELKELLVGCKVCKNWITLGMD
ncbi:MAG: hypothetical protein IJ353_00335 [Lachnospiraceae bacterium]|nr:hypothetical protein [Lachnospiraceae bacterium]